MGKRLPLGQVKPLKRGGIESVGDIGIRRVPNGARLLRVFVYCIIGDVILYGVAICI